MKLILLRHGMTEANEKHLYCGITDVPLSEKGREEILQKKAALIASLSNAVSFDTGHLRILTSSLLRCEETLSLLFGNIPHETEPDFTEMDFGDFEMHSYEELKDTPKYQEWLSGDNFTNKAPHGESGADMTKRAVLALDRYIAKNRDTLIITHGGVIAALMAHLFPEEPKTRYDWQPAFARGYIVDTTQHSYIAIPNK